MSDIQTRSRRNSKKKNKKHVESVCENNEKGVNCVQETEEPVKLKKRNSKRRKLKSLLRNSIGKITDDRKNGTDSKPINKDICEKMDESCTSTQISDKVDNDVVLNCNPNKEMRYEDENQNFRTMNDIETETSETVAQIQNEPKQDSGPLTECDLNNSDINSFCDQSEETISKDLSLLNEDSYVQCIDEQNINQIYSPGCSIETNIDVFSDDANNFENNNKTNLNETCTVYKDKNETINEDFVTLIPDKDNCDCLTNHKENSTDSSKNEIEFNKENCSDNNENFHLVPECSASIVMMIDEDTSSSNIQKSNMNIHSDLTVSDESIFLECNNDSDLIYDCDSSTEKETIDSNLRTNIDSNLVSLSEFTQCDDNSNPVFESNVSVKITEEEPEVFNHKSNTIVDVNDLNNIIFLECNNNLLSECDSSIKSTDDKVTRSKFEINQSDVSVSCVPVESSEQMSECINNFCTELECNPMIKGFNDVTLKSNIPINDKNETDSDLNTIETNLSDSSFDLTLQSEQVISGTIEEMTDISVDINNKNCTNVDVNQIVLDENKDMESNKNVHLIPESDSLIGACNTDISDSFSQNLNKSDRDINVKPISFNELQCAECNKNSDLIPECTPSNNNQMDTFNQNDVTDSVVIDKFNFIEKQSPLINIITEEITIPDMNIESKEFKFPNCPSKQFLSDPYTATLDEIELVSNPKQKQKKSSTANNIKKVFMSPFLKRKNKKDDSNKSNKSLERSNSRVSLASLSEEETDCKKDFGCKKNPFHLGSIIKKKTSKQQSVDNLDRNLHRSDSKVSLYSNASDSRNSNEMDRKMVSFGSEQSLSRKPSFIKKVSKFLGSTPNLHRASSFRDVYTDKKYTDRLFDARASGWSSSLQSLDEDNVLIDKPDHCSVMSNSKRSAPNVSDESSNEYDEFGQRKLIRTQSLSMPNSSGVGRRCGVSHGAVLARHYQSNLDISAQTPSSLAVSLPALHCLPENVDLGNSSPNTSHHRYRRRVPSSICGDEDGSTTGSFQGTSTGSGCAKLKHHYRYDAQKRDAADTFSSGASSGTVRSRSLTHLDNLDPELLREPRPADTAGLKDSRSEPDCSMQHPLLAVPSTTSHPSAANRRHMMSRSQVSSSEYFSVEFDIYGDTHPSQGREEFLPATKGTILGDILGSACERRGIDISNCDVFVEDRKSPLPHLSSETSWLGGKQLHVTAKDPSNKKSNLSTHIRKSSGSYRSKPGKFFSISTEEASISPNPSVLSLQDTRLILQDGESKKKEKQRWSGFFSNNKDTKMELLVEHLNNYSKQGVPKRTDQSDENSESVKALYNLEDDWRQLINSANISEREQQQQTAFWELISTEAAYIKTLKVVTDLFLACLECLQASNILNEINKTKLFSNILGIHSANLFFWCKHIYPMLKHTRETSELLNPEYLLSGFEHFHEIFEPYTKYCSDQSKCQHYCKEMHSQNELFTAYLVWCETRKECNRLRLMDILVRPMQRLTKYGLLLKAIYKNSDLDSHKECLNAMIKSVDDFVNSVNSTLKYKQDSESLLRIMNRIESYDAVESKDDDLEKMVRNYSDIDLMRPMIGCNVDRRRHLLMEDDFKLKDNITTKMEVRCILFTDLLLICKLSTKKGSNGIKVIRQPYLIDRLVSTDLNREPASIGFVYLNELNMAIAAFTLQGDTKKLKNLMEYIAKAKALYRQAKLASTPVVRQQSINELIESNDISIEYSGENDGHSLLGMPLFSRSPLANSSRGSRVSSLAHSHSGSVEMNDQSSVGSVNTQSRAVSVETDQRTASISSDEGVQSLPVETSLKSPVAPKTTLKHRLFNAHPRITTPNTLSVQPCTSLGQSLPNLTLGSPNMGTIQFISPSQNTLSVPSAKNQQHLLSPNHRGISYPPPSPTRGNLRRGFAINQNKNPPLLKTRHVTSTVGTGASISGPMSIDIDVPVIPGVSLPDDTSETLLSGQQKQQAINKRLNRSDNRRYHTAGVVDEIRKNDGQDTNLQKRLSWNCGSYNDQLEPNKTEDHSSTT